MSLQVACAVADVEPGTALRLELAAADGTLVEIALIRTEAGEFHAVSDVCSHGAVSLSDGEIEGCSIECWLHGSQFDLRTGAPLSLPAVRAIPVYPVRLDGDAVLVDVDVALVPASSPQTPKEEI